MEEMSTMDMIVAGAVCIAFAACLFEALTMASREEWKR